MWGDEDGSLAIACMCTARLILSTDNTNKILVCNKRLTLSNAIKLGEY